MANWFKSWLWDWMEPYNTSPGSPYKSSEEYKASNPYRPKSASSSTPSTVYDFANLTSALQAEAAASRYATDQSLAEAQRNRIFQQNSAREAMNFSAQQAELNRAFQQSSANKAMQFEADQAALGRDWQERMSNSVYQRGIKDLKAAGLSPLLAYQNLSTSSPSGFVAGGSLASGDSASGLAASGSQGTVFKPNYSSAKKADIDSYLDSWALGVNSGTSLVTSLISGLFGLAKRR